MKTVKNLEKRGLLGICGCSPTGSYASQLSPSPSSTSSSLMTGVPGHKKNIDLQLYHQTNDFMLFLCLVTTGQIHQSVKSYFHGM